MPVYNEEDCIEIVATQWIELARRYNGIVLILNDGSKDSTREKLIALNKEHPNLQVINKKNSGHGPTILTGYELAIKSGAPWVFQTDSDNQFLTNDFDSFWQIRDSADLVLGFRKVRHDDYHRLVITKIMRLVNLALYGVWVRDANVPYRLFSRSALEELLRHIPKNVFAPNIFLSVTAKKMKMSVVEKQITHLPRETGVVSIVSWGLLKACLRSLLQLMSFRLGLYSPSTNSGKDEVAKS